VIYAVDIYIKGLLFGGNDAQRMFFGLRLMENTVFTSFANHVNSVFNSDPFGVILHMGADD
jgi:hypothetical protein